MKTAFINQLIQEFRTAKRAGWCRSYPKAFYFKDVEPNGLEGYEEGWSSIDCYYSDEAMIRILEDYKKGIKPEHNITIIDKQGIWHELY